MLLEISAGFIAREGLIYSFYISASSTVDVYCKRKSHSASIIINFTLTQPVELPPPLTDAEKQKYDQKFPDHSWAISHAAHKGRYLTAGRPIKAGELVMTEYPYSFVALPFNVSTTFPPRVDNVRF